MQVVVLKLIAAQVLRSSIREFLASEALFHLVRPAHKICASHQKPQAGTLAARVLPCTPRMLRIAAVSYAVCVAVWRPSVCVPNVLDLPHTSVLSTVMQEHAGILHTGTEQLKRALYNLPQHACAMLRLTWNSARAMPCRACRLRAPAAWSPARTAWCATCCTRATRCASAARSCRASRPASCALAPSRSSSRWTRRRVRAALPPYPWCCSLMLLASRQDTGHRLHPSLPGMLMACAGLECFDYMCLTV
jgi:hypothetical protein